MKIEAITLENFKNMTETTLEFKDQTTGIYGPNGSGKTSIIEAIQVMKAYVTIADNKPNDFAGKYFRTGAKTMKICVTFSDENELLQYEIIFENFDGLIQVVEETVHVKANKPRSKYQLVLKLANGSEQLQPEVTGKKQRKMEAIQYEKNTYVHFMKYNSFFSLLNTEKNRDYLGLQKFNKIQQSLEKLVVSMLTDSAVAQLQLILPLHVQTDMNHGVFPFQLNGGYHSRTHVELLKTVLRQVNDIFHAIFPERVLELKENDSRQDEHGEQVSVTLYVKRGEIAIPIAAESTGTIKLVSLLSALIAYVKYPDFILFVDELDAHLYEYLLAVLLEKLSVEAKGQLVFTAHNLSPLERLGKNSIVFANEKNDTVSFEYLKGVKKTTNIRDKYLRAVAYSTEENIELSGVNESALEMIVGNL